jgi:hypothetical protein
MATAKPKSTKATPDGLARLSRPRARRGEDDPIARLSFVAMRDGRALLLPTEGQFPRCFWHVKPTGDLRADDLAGEKLALEYLAFEEADKGGMGNLQLIVGDMPRKLGPIEISFLAMVSYAAGAGRRRAEEAAAYYNRCRKEEARP